MWEHGCARVALLLPLAGSLLLTGCTGAGSPFAARRETLALKRSLAGLQDQNAELQMRSNSLDADNQQLQSMLAQEQQRAAQIEAENGDLRSQLQQARMAQRRQPAQYSQAAPSSAAGTGYSGSASTSWLPVAQVPGAEAYRDGNVVRIRLSNANLFNPGSATLRRDAKSVLDRVASAIRQNYPSMLIGIEGHTDADPIRKSKWKSNHELSVNRAMAVYEYLSKNGTIPTSQLFVAGYGPNSPIAANTSSRGKSQNRRVEFVVYPESMAQR